VSLRAEIRECPATYGLAAGWIAVYLAMLAVQGGSAGAKAGFLGFGAIDPSITELFGDLTGRDFARGQVWRVVTATFIHFGAAHLVMNLIGMIQLGRLMEPWYGGRQFLAICLGLGGAGNLLGVGMRQAVAAGRAWLQAHGMARALPAALAGGPPGMAQNIHAGGGSTVILGLIGLGLVVGWRSRTRVGAFLRDQMVAFLVFTALIGIVGMKIVDNYGHAGGAIAGAALGFFHRGLVRSAEGGGRGRRLAGWASALVLLGCIGGQSYAARGNLAEARRFAAYREAVARVRQIDEVLIPSLVGLQLLTERVAFDRALAAFEESVLRGDPTLALGSDYGFVLEVFAQLGPVSRPPAVRAQELAALRALAEQVNDIGANLEPGLVDDAYREAVAIARALGTGPIDSRMRYALRVDLEDLAARAKRSRDDWKAKRDALEVAVAAR
jgi:membrane associated rhomboid family serine protease